MEIFADRLKILLKENNITKYKIAKDFKCSKQTVCNWCDNVNEPKVKDIIRLANYFNVSADYLLGLENSDGSKTIK